MEILISLTVSQIESVADQLRAHGFNFDVFETDNDTYAKIIQAVFDGLELDFDKAMQDK